MILPYHDRSAFLMFRIVEYKKDEKCICKIVW